MDREPTTEKETLESLLRRVQGNPIQDRPASTAFEAVEGVDDKQEAVSHHPRTELLRSVRLKVRAELGRARLPLKDALQLGPGSIVDLEKFADDPVDLYVNDVLVARGEVLVINDSFCIRVTEVLSQGVGEEEA